jgi:hypothetical protein
MYEIVLEGMIKAVVYPNPWYNEGLLYIGPTTSLSWGRK